MHFLSLTELNADNLQRLVDLGMQITRNGIQACTPLTGKVVGIYFAGPSTRTRTSFASAAQRLGASIIQYGPGDLQLSTGETPEDTGRVLSQYLDALVIRTNGSDSEMEALASQDKMAVINAMSEQEHPTQVIGDLITIKEATGGLSGRRIVYMGEGNNTAAALAHAVSLVEGMELLLFTPENYGLNSSLLEKAKSRAQENGALIEEYHSLKQLPEKADVVYTTRWETMGVSHADPNWRDAFRALKVSEEIMQRFRQTGKTIFMHDLPAVRGQDVDSSVLDGKDSVAFRQAYHKMTAAMAILSIAMNETSW